MPVNYNAFNVDPNQYMQQGVGNALNAYGNAANFGIAQDRNAIAREGQEINRQELAMRQNELAMRQNERELDRKQQEESRKFQVFGKGLEWASQGVTVDDRNSRLGEVGGMLKKNFGVDVDYGNYKFVEGSRGKSVIRTEIPGQGPVDVEVDAEKYPEVLRVLNDTKLPPDQRLAVASMHGTIKRVEQDSGTAIELMKLDQKDRHFNAEQKAEKERAKREEFDNFSELYENNSLLKAGYTKDRDGNIFKNVPDGAGGVIPQPVDGDEAARIQKAARRDAILIKRISDQEKVPIQEAEIIFFQKLREQAQDEAFKEAKRVREEGNRLGRAVRDNTAVTPEMAQSAERTSASPYALEGAENPITKWLTNNPFNVGLSAKEAYRKRTQK